MAAALLLCLSEDLNNTLTRVPHTHTHVCLLLNSSVMHDVMIFWAKDKNMLIRSLLFEMCVKLQTADFPPQDSRREECRATRAAWLSNSTSPSLSGIRRSVPLCYLCFVQAHICEGVPLICKISTLLKGQQRAPWWGPSTRPAQRSVEKITGKKGEGS